MNQVQIGQFIAQCRKEKGLTQLSLGEKLGVSDRAVSKWENGRCLPDASVFQSLCRLLEISVNELLTGEHIAMEDYKKIAEENLIKLRELEEKTNRKLLNAEKVFVTVSIISLVSLFLCASYFFEQGLNAAGIVLYVLGIAVLVVTVCFGIKIEHEAGYYECPNCRNRYVPTMKAVIMAPHFGTTRKMLCPACNKKGYHKKVLTKD